MKPNQRSLNVAELHRRMGYCAAQIEKCLLQANQGYWAQLESELQKTIKELRLCEHDAKYLKEDES
jgi:hypothetical protein